MSKKVEGKTADEWVEIGLQTAQSGDFWEASMQFEKAIEANPEHEKVYYYLGAAYEKLGLNPPGIMAHDTMYEKAVDAFEKAVELDPKNTNAYNLLGKCYEKLKKFKKAAEAYERCLQIDPKNENAAFNIGNAYSYMDGDENKQKAIDLYKKFISDHPDDYEAWNNIGLVHSDLQQFEKAIEYYEKSIKINPNNQGYYSMGTAYGQLKKFDKEIECYKKALEIYPNDHHSWNNLGASYKDLGQQDTADYIWSITDKVEARQLHIHNKQELWDIFSVIEGYSLVGRGKEANECMKLGQQSGNTSEARKHFEKAYELYKENNNKLGMGNALRHKGATYRSEKEWEKCLETMLEAYKIYEEVNLKMWMAETIHNAGYCYFFLDKLDKAIEFFNKSVKLHEEIDDKHRMSDGLSNIGLIYKKQGNKEKALEYFKKTYTIDEELGDERRMAQDQKDIESVS